MLTATLRAALVNPQNKLLKALSFDDFNQLKPHLKRVEWSGGEVLYNVGEPIKHIYFPESGIVTSVSFFEDGASVESGITGNEGMTGGAAALSGESSPRETAVQSAGAGWKLASQVFRAAFERGGAFQNLVLRYINTFHEQVAQSGACINHHPINKRLARWLLMCHDRTEGNELHITHDFMAQMLGVNRPSVTCAAIELKDEKLIEYSRGIVKILDRAGLEDFTCECYEQIKLIYNKYLSLLEFRQSNRHLDRPNGKMATEIRRRDVIQSVAQDRVQRLKQTAGQSVSPAQRVRVCRNCQRLCDFRNNPAAAGQYIGRQINAEFVPVVCLECSRKR